VKIAGIVKHLSFMHSVQTTYKHSIVCMLFERNATTLIFSLLKDLWNVRLL